MRCRLQPQLTVEQVVEEEESGEDEDEKMAWVDESGANAYDNEKMMIFTYSRHYRNQNPWPERNRERS